MSTWNLSETKHHVLICNGGSCMRQEGEEVTQAIRDEIKNLGLDQQIHTTRTRCNGRCEDACVVIVYPQGTWYHSITPDAGRELVKQLAGSQKEHISTISYSFENGYFQPNEQTRVGIQKK